MHVEKKSVESKLGYALLFFAAAISIIITPNVIFDPINLPKLLTLSIAGLGFGATLLNKSARDFLAKEKLLKWLSYLIFIDLLAILFFSGTNFDRSLFGTHGRNMGFLSYFSLVSIFLVAMKLSTQLVINHFSKLLIFLGVLAAIYGLLQSKSWDPISWQNELGPVVGFFGNANFQSAFLGLATICSISQIFARAVSLALRSGYLFASLIMAYVILLTSSSQGFFIIAAGVFVLILILALESRRKFLYVPLLCFGGVASIFTIMGLLGSGPFKSLILDSTLFVRRFFWEAAWNMTVQHPLLGVGFDGYIDWYRRTRPLEALTDANVNIKTDSAHNIFLDISSSGGFPLLLCYLLIQIYTGISIVKILKRDKSYSPHLVGLTAAWVGYQVFSLVSISQIGIAVWGWLFSGLLIGYELQSRPAMPKQERNQTIRAGGTPGRPFKGQKLSLPVGMLFSAGAVLGLVISAPIFVGSANYVNALKVGQVQLLRDVATSRPIDEQRIVGVAQLFLANNLNQEALELARLASEYFPDSSFAWEALLSNPTLTPTERTKVKQELKRLDPNNTRLVP